MRSPLGSLVVICCVLLPSARALADDDKPGTDTGAQPVPRSSDGEAQPRTPRNKSDSMLGGPGESCTARSDCQQGLKCFETVCTDENEGASCRSRSDCGGRIACIDNVCTSERGSGGGAGGGRRGTERDAFTGTHGFFGISVLEGPYLGGGLGNAFCFSLRGGVLFGHGEFAAEISPMTQVFSPGGPAFQTNATIGGHVPLSNRVSWPLRFGVGIVAAGKITYNDSVFMQLRADLIGVSAKWGGFLLDFTLPSYRFYIFPGDGGMGMAWISGVSASFAP
jgi:hypothetical protein